MTVRHVFRKATRTAEETAQLRADRERYRREKPAPEQLLAEGSHTEFTTMGQLLLLHQITAWLKQERARQGLTLGEMWKRAGIDPAALSRLETGKNGHRLIRAGSGLTNSPVYARSQTAPNPWKGKALWRQDSPAKGTSLFTTPWPGL
jgi:hypothetical protein